MEDLPKCLYKSNLYSVFLVLIIFICIFRFISANQTIVWLNITPWRQNKSRSKLKVLHFFILVREIRWWTQLCETMVKVLGQLFSSITRTILKLVIHSYLHQPERSTWSWCLHYEHNSWIYLQGKFVEKLIISKLTTHNFI